MKRIVVGSLVSSLAIAGAVLLAPAEAQACGGTFCDGGPQPMPVDQSGENILFVRDGDFIEAHIQIQYEGEAERFGWVIPMQSVPEFSVGSDPLFQSLLTGSVPTYFTQTSSDDCSLGDEGDDGADNGEGTGGAAGDGGDDDDDDGGPDILLQETVGAFEITVLQSEDAQEVVDWLIENDYQTDDAAIPILQEYIAEDHIFGAVKLTSNTDTNEIHPIVLRFQGDEPCIPLRLTRIAAEDDMDIRVFFLGDYRVVPKTYRHLLVNPLKIDWINNADNYKEVISLAVDTDMGGRAFVTEYAGTSDVVPTFGLTYPDLDPEAFVTANPVDVVDMLTSAGAYFCDGFESCGSPHPLVQPIVSEFLPVPNGLEPFEFYECLSCYEEMIDPMAWDGQAFADALASRVVDPGEHAARMLETNTYLTRMYTTISPNEMMEDPMFHENRELPEVIAARTGRRRFLCNGDSVYTLPDGREVYLPAGTTDWPDFTEEPAWEQPYEEELQEIMSEGAPMVLTTQTEVIDTALAAYNAAHGWPGGGDGDDDDDDGGSSGGGDDGGTGGTGGNQDGGDDGTDVDGNTGGCGCRSTGGPMGFAWALAFGVGLMSLRRRRD